MTGLWEQFVDEAGAATMWLTAAMVGLAALLFAWRRFFRLLIAAWQWFAPPLRPPVGDRRCIECRYSLRKSTTRCPECGCVVSASYTLWELDERSLRRVGRAWLLLLVVVLAATWGRQLWRWAGTQASTLLGLNLRDPVQTLLRARAEIETPPDGTLLTVPQEFWLVWDSIAWGTLGALALFALYCLRPVLRQSQQRAMRRWLLLLGTCGAGLLIAVWLLPHWLGYSQLTRRVIVFEWAFPLLVAGFAARLITLIPDYRHRLARGRAWLGIICVATWALAMIAVMICSVNSSAAHFWMYQGERFPQATQIRPGYIVHFGHYSAFYHEVPQAWIENYDASMQHLMTITPRASARSEAALQALALSTFIMYWSAIPLLIVLAWYWRLALRVWRWKRVSDSSPHRFQASPARPAPLAD